MKGITLCAECAYYSMKKHECTRGATDEGDAWARFYADCPLDTVAPVVHGRWIPKYIPAHDCGNSTHKLVYVCDQCGRQEPKPEPYCNCGAKMEGDE